MQQILKLYVEKGKLKFEKVIVENEYDIDYQVLHNSINGMIEYVSYVDCGNSNVCLIVDEEGILKKLQPTFWIIDEKTHNILENPLVGTVLVVKNIGENTVGISDDDIEKFLSKIQTDNQGHYYLPLSQKYLQQKKEFYEMLEKMGLDIEYHKMS